LISYYADTGPPEPLMLGVQVRAHWERKV
jgi:hypothetical protein